MFCKEKSGNPACCQADAEVLKFETDSQVIGLWNLLSNG
jgi:hypothetical protein